MAQIKVDISKVPVGQITTETNFNQFVTVPLSGSNGRRDMMNTINQAVIATFNGARDFSDIIKKIAGGSLNEEYVDDEGETYNYSVITEEIRSTLVTGVDGNLAVYGVNQEHFIFYTEEHLFGKHSILGGIPEVGAGIRIIEAFGKQNKGYAYKGMSKLLSGIPASFFDGTNLVASDPGEMELELGSEGAGFYLQGVTTKTQGWSAVANKIEIGGMAEYKDLAVIDIELGSKKYQAYGMFAELKQRADHMEMVSRSIMFDKESDADYIRPSSGQPVQHSNGIMNQRNVDNLQLINKLDILDIANKLVNRTSNLKMNTLPVFALHCARKSYALLSQSAAELNSSYKTQNVTGGEFIQIGNHITSVTIPGTIKLILVLDEVLAQNNELLNLKYNGSPISEYSVLAIPSNEVKVKGVTLPAITLKKSKRFYHKSTKVNSPGGTGAAGYAEVVSQIDQTSLMTRSIFSVAVHNPTAVVEFRLNTVN